MPNDTHAFLYHTNDARTHVCIYDLYGYMVLQQGKVLEVSL